MTSRLSGIPALFLVAACATTGTTQRSSLSPQRGPKAHIYANYSGGLTNRMVRASFKVDRAGHVLVGHLGGDGRITILYPESAEASTAVRAGKSYHVPAFEADYDAVPQLYTLTSRAYRSVGARIDSYDGRGNGFVFIVATQYPMFTDGIQDHGSWSSDLEVHDYHWSSDPRVAIRDLAEEVTRGMPYTLDYADSFGSTTNYTYADAAFDCSVLSASRLGYSPNYFGYVGWWMPLTLTSPSWYFQRPPMFFTNAYTSLTACGSRYAWMGPRFYSYGYGAWGKYPPYYGRWTWSPPTTIVPPSKPKAPERLGFSTTSRRPGFRNGDESGPALSLTRPRLTGQREQVNTDFSSWPTRMRVAGERQRATSGSSWSPSRPTAPRGESADPRPTRLSDPGSFGGTRSTWTTSTSTSATSRPAAPAASAPVSRDPPAKVTAASAGKPREP